MSINLDVLIATPDHSIDMNVGLATFRGASEATRIVAETVLTGEIVQRLSHKSKVRTNLKRNFKGSYGQIYSLDIYDEELDDELKKIGKATFIEVLAYFIAEAMYVDSREVTLKAKKVIEGLGEVSEQLVLQLRRSSLANLHEATAKLGYDVSLRYRKNRLEQDVVAKFDKETYKSLQARMSAREYDVFASITRLNINTGNGRLLLKDNLDTTAFGFGTLYREVKLEAKKKFSENLDANNGRSTDEWVLLKLKVRPVKLRDGKIIKYIITGFYDD